MKEDFKKKLLEMLETEIDIEKQKVKTYRNTRPFELLLEPHHISKSGLNAFRVINCHTCYGRIKYFTMRLEMSNCQTKVVRFSYEHNLDLIPIIKDAMKKDNIIHIALNDVRLVSYSFNNSTGIVMNSSGFRILNILERNDSK